MKKRIMCLILAVLVVVTFAGCTQEDWNYLIHKSLELLGYSKQELTLTEIDLEKTEEAMLAAGLEIDTIPAEDISDDLLEQYGIDNSLKPLSVLYAIPSASVLDETIVDNLDMLTEIKLAVLLEYETPEQAESAAAKINEMLEEKASEITEFLTGNGASEELVSILSVLMDFINVQAVDGRVAVYTTPAGELYIGA